MNPRGFHSRWHCFLCPSWDWQHLSWRSHVLKHADLANKISPFQAETWHLMLFMFTFFYGTAAFARKSAPKPHLYNHSRLKVACFSRMRSEGSRFIWGSGGEAVFAESCVYVRNRSQPSATVCVRAVRLSTVASASGVIQKVCEVDALSPQLYWCLQRRCLCE